VLSEDDGVVEESAEEVGVRHGAGSQQQAASGCLPPLLDILPEDMLVGASRRVPSFCSFLFCVHPLQTRANPHDMEVRPPRVRVQSTHTHIRVRTRSSAEPRRA
jgi:hypothetical protein